ncbi:MAG: M48 family metalloprotease [Acidobacteria bacterium]|nr:M48 family metalloprotease [Acidobacteriota bacterium]
MKKDSMKTIVLAAALVACAAPSFAQLGGALRRVQQARDAKDKLDDLNVTEEEERTIGEGVSAKIRARFGVVQDPAIHEYVALVGLTLARLSDRPGLPWTFVVLDTDGVNAFASPGGIVHVTRGALALVASEAELAAVLGHEIGHVARKHTVNAIQKSKAVQLGTSETLASRGPFLDLIANKAYEMVLENKFDRGDEMDADKVSVALAGKAGYAPGKLADFLTRLDERNRDQPAANGLFASHPDMTARIQAIAKLAGTRGGPTVEARYASNVKYEPVDVTKIATVEEGAAGLAGSTGGKAGAKKDEKVDAAPKKGFGLASLSKSAGSERQTAQVSASGGARGVGPDRMARGGGNPSLVKVAVSDAALAAFKKGIA